MPKKTLAVMAAALATVAVAPVMSAPAANAATSAEKAQARRTAVYVQGDSLTVGAGPYLQRTLRGDVKRVSVDAQVGRFTATGMHRLAQSGSARGSKVWVVALGTNDGPDPRALKRHVTRSLRLAGPRRDVIWLTVERPGGYGRVNRMLRQMDRGNDRLHVVDWAGYVHKHPSALAGDGVHATARGYQVRANMIAATALQLAQNG